MTVPSGRSETENPADTPPGHDLQYVVFGRIPWSGVWLNRHYHTRELSASETVVYVTDRWPISPWRRRAAVHRDRKWALGRPTVPPGVHLVQSVELPFQRAAPMRRATAAIEAARIRRYLSSGAGTVAVYFPRSHLHEPGALGESLSVYFCPDDFRFHDDGTRDDEFCDWEDLALARCGLVITVTEPLAARLRRSHPRVRVVENGFDEEFFHPVESPPPEDLRSIARPIIGFVGSVRAPLIDFGVIRQAAARKPKWSFCLIGWYDREDPDLLAVRALPNVHILGPRPREQLASYMSAMDVMTSPYVKAAAAAPALPLKAFESLAVGRPLVAMHAPLLDGYRPHLRNADTIDGFLSEIEDLLAHPVTDPHPSRHEWTWRRRATLLRRHICEALIATGRGPRG